jgi:hypothetical protein
MELKHKLAAGAVVMCAVLGVAAFAFWPRADAEVTAKEPVGAYGTATIAPKAPSGDTDEPSDAEAAEAAKAAANAEADSDDPGTTDENHVDYISTGPNENLNDHFKAAGAAVLSYTTVTPGETVEARSARLTPYFVPGSELLTNEPDLVNPRGLNNMETTIVTRGIPMAGFDSESDGVYRVKVLLDYTATYDLAGQPMEVLGTGVWFVTMNTSFDGLVLDIEEPDGR